MQEFLRAVWEVIYSSYMTTGWQGCEGSGLAKHGRIQARRWGGGGEWDDQKMVVIWRLMAALQGAMGAPRVAIPCTK